MVRALALALVFVLPATSGPARAEHVCRITGQVVRPCAGDLAGAAPSLERGTCCDLRISASADAGVHHEERAPAAPPAALVTAIEFAFASLLAPRDVPRATSAGPPLYLRSSSLLI
jgi:hypothetical protein